MKPQNNFPSWINLIDYLFNDVKDGGDTPHDVVEP